MDTETALIVIVLFQSGVIAVMTALVLLTAWYRGVTIDALIRRVKKLESKTGEDLYRALGAAVAITVFHFGRTSTMEEDAKSAETLIKAYAEEGF